MTTTNPLQILTKQGEELLARLAAEEKELVIDKFIFADVPDRGEFPSREEAIPHDYIVHEEPIGEKGRLTENSVIYTATLASDVGPFYFNWSGLYCSEHNVLVTIHYPKRTPKTQDQPGIAGNTLVRSQVLQYTGVAEITNITVDASTWQYNSNDRLKKMDADVAQALIDQNGKDWFIGDGFQVLPKTDTSVAITPGAGYVSGNRVSLGFERIISVPSKPAYIYLDAKREGTPTGEQITTFNFVVSAEEKDDYIDTSTGKQIPHFVCKIAQVLGDGSVSDLRPEKTQETWVKDNLKRQSTMILNKDHIAGTTESLIGMEILGHKAIQVDDYPKGGESAFFILVPQYDGAIKSINLQAKELEFEDETRVQLLSFSPQQFIAVEPKEFDSVQSLFSHLSSTRQQCITSAYSIDIDSEVRTGNNTKFIGTGTNFGTQIRGGKDSSFIMDGFHNVLSDLVFMIEDCESTTFFEMNSYTNILKNVWFHNAGSKGEGRQTIIKLAHGGDCLLEDVKIRPKGVTAGRTSTGILVDMPIINGGSVAHRAKLVRPDVEGMTDCIHVKNGSADIYSPHIERIGSVGLIIDDGAEAVVHGGDFIYGGGSGIPIIQKGSGKLTLISPNFYRPDGSDKKLVIIQGDASQCVFINVDPDLVGYDIGAVGYPKFVTSDRRGNLNYINPYMNELSAGSKALLFRVKKFAQGEFINDIELDVFADSKQYTIIKRKYTLTIASLDALINHTDIKQVYENKVSSGNYAFDFTVSAELEGSSVAIYIIPTLTGNSDLQGSTVNVNARLMLQGNTKYTQILDK